MSTLAEQGQGYSFLCSHAELRPVFKRAGTEARAARPWEAARGRPRARCPLGVLAAGAAPAVSSAALPRGAASGFRLGCTSLSGVMKGGKLPRRFRGKTRGAV